jgi:hypothetical protein
MKKVYVIRHAPKDDVKGELTKKGKRKPESLGRNSQNLM